HNPDQLRAVSEKTSPTKITAVVPEPRMEIPNLTACCRDGERAERIARTLAERLGKDDYAELAAALARVLPGNPDPDMALNKLERYLAAAPGALRELLDPDGAGLEILLPILGTSQFLADTLAADPDFLDMLRVPLRHSPGPAELRRELRQEITAAADD